MRWHASAERSAPEEAQWFFTYNINIINESNETVQLLERQWIIPDADGNKEEVRGPGVIGEQPILRPGENFEYRSGCPLTTAVGSMYGHYLMAVYNSDETFEVKIAPFTLAEQYAVN